MTDIQAALDKPNSILYIQGSSKNACPAEADRYVGFLTNNKIFALVLIALSIFLMFGGLFFLKYMVSIIGFAAGFVITLMCAVGLKNPYTWTTFMYIFVFVLAVAVGAFLAWVSYYFTDVSMIITGGSLGFFVGFKLVEAINASQGQSSDAV